MNALGENAASQDADKIRQQFHHLLTKANKERPCPTDLQALNALLYKNKEMELWRAAVGMGELAESQALDTIVNGSGQGMRECWRQRLKAMRADLGHAESSPLKRLLIQQVTLCWLNLNLTEYRHTNVMKQSISFACGIYWEKRLTAAQSRPAQQPFIFQRTACYFRVATNVTRIAGESPRQIYRPDRLRHFVCPVNWLARIIKVTVHNEDALAR